MITICVIIGILSILAGFSNSIMDTIKFHYHNSIFSKMKEGFWKTWFDPNSWKLKWKYVNGERIKLERAPWYYLWIYNPGYKERFIYSSTLFVGATNAWHFFQSVMFTSLQVAILLPLGLLFSFTFWQYIVAIIVMKLALSCTFELFWNKIWKK